MDKTGFNQMVAQLRPKMYRFALAFVKRRDEAEDVIQDVSMNLWKRRTSLGSVRSVEAYAMSAVKNRCMDYLRSMQGKTDELTKSAHTAHEQTPYASVEQADMVAQVKKLIEGLPVQQQMVIRLRDVEGYELDEVAEILGMSEGAVRTGLSRARQKIREQLFKQ
ncbi:MAG: sigma-70 family RNA polymerase sigma factor [Prevotellaceae bacterium]|jgi:RNA polymerase sigma-70 factor (ECF subfamily)|nr:sigma-70 family RNA polymerase sigma factor [Prevotellaceae bacterium]